MAEDADDLVRHALGIALLGALPGQLLQRLLGTEAGNRRLFGILIGKLIEREATPLRNRPGARERFRVAAEKARHLFRRLQVAIGVTLATKAGVVDGAIVPDAGHDILKDAPPRNVEENIIGDDGRHARVDCHVRQFVEPHGVVRPPPQC